MKSWHNEWNFFSWYASNAAQLEPISSTLRAGLRAALFNEPVMTNPAELFP
jgi:hypothetical protein